MAMQRTIWAVKRAHWRSWAGSLRLLRTGGLFNLRTTRKLTPARYDVLHLLGQRGGAMVQKAMCAALGVVKSTLSELLTTMERLGLVSRSRFTRAGRTVTTVTVTDVGREAWNDAFLIEMEIDGLVTNAFNSDRRQLTAERACLEVRKAFGDLGPRLLYEFLVVDD